MFGNTQGVLTIFDWRQPYTNVYVHINIKWCLFWNFCRPFVVSLQYHSLSIFNVTSNQFSVKYFALCISLCILLIYGYTIPLVLYI